MLLKNVRLNARILEQRTLADLGGTLFSAQTLISQAWQSLNLSLETALLVLLQPSMAPRHNVIVRHRIIFAFLTFFFQS
jgi:hypothetical protein